MKYTTYKNYKTHNLPNADKDKLILVASFKRSPVAPVLLCMNSMYISF